VTLPDDLTWHQREARQVRLTSSPERDYRTERGRNRGASAHGSPFSLMPVRERVSAPRPPLVGEERGEEKGDAGIRSRKEKPTVRAVDFSCVLTPPEGGRVVSRERHANSRSSESIFSFFLNNDKRKESSSNFLVF